MVRSNNPYTASLGQWQAAIEQGRFDGEFGRIYGREQVAAWRANYLEALRHFVARYGSRGRVVVARCPGQMNVMGMHIDYGGMPSVRMAVRGADTLVVARAATSRRVRLASFLRSSGASVDRFEPIEIDLEAILPKARVAERQALMDYAGQVCRQRLERTGNALASDWSALVEGQLVYLESYFRGRMALGGLDGLVWSNVSPSGGMSSSSALVVATALATMGVHGLVPRRDMPEADLVDGLGTSEWMRGTRGGTADHGGMILGQAGKLVGVGVFPARVQGEAALPDEYAAIVLDSGVVREYDEAVKEETVIAYPLGTFIARELILRWLMGRSIAVREQVRYIRDVVPGPLSPDSTEPESISLVGLYRVLGYMPKKTSLAQIAAQAQEAGVGAHFEEMYQREITGKFQLLSKDTPLFIRRRCVYGLAEQDRVAGMLAYLNAGDMATALELIRISHDGDLDREVEDEVLAQLVERAERGEERTQLRFLPGGYGRMTPAYDRTVRVVNRFLSAEGPTAGAVQRLGAGWGGNIGGLVHRAFVDGERRAAFAEMLRTELGHEPELAVAVPGEGAGLLAAPQGD
ncbi:MAG: hypothetical protein F4Z85_06630 [Gemmatimonadetes bacterium]|nr:hypothetical protein [Gemmatimonadota bacterium]MYB70633.1 hypothetical protein [Gemmatimonadota bacterium]